MTGNVLPANNADINGPQEKQTFKPLTGSAAARNHTVAIIGEFFGTAMFIMLSCGATSVALQPNNSIPGHVSAGAARTDSSNLLYIAFSFGFALAVSVFCFFRVSGGLFNPAVTLAFVTLGAISPLRGVLLFITQIAGALAGAGIAQGLMPGPLFAMATLGGGASVVQGFFIEFFMTAVLVFTILMVAVEKNRGTFMAPLAIGLALFVCELFSVYYTGGALNPARAFAPCVVNTTFQGYHWIYWIAPLTGGLLAVALYKLLKFLQYENNLGPDADGDAYSYALSHDIRDRLVRIEHALASNANAAAQV